MGNNRPSWAVVCGVGVRCCCWSPHLCFVTLGWLAGHKLAVLDVDHYAPPHALLHEALHPHRVEVLAAPCWRLRLLFVAAVSDALGRGCRGHGDG